jgi:hypothetical protein
MVCPRELRSERRVRMVDDSMLWRLKWKSVVAFAWVGVYSGSTSTNLFLNALRRGSEGGCKAEVIGTAAFLIGASSQRVEELEIDELEDEGERMSAMSVMSMLLRVSSVNDMLVMLGVFVSINNNKIG